MKAVSPFIATVLLIAFTIGIAATVGYFIYGTMQSQNDEVEKTSERSTRCGSVFLTIDDVVADSDLDPVNLTLSYTSGSEPLYNFTVYIIDSSNNLSSNSTIIPAFTVSSPFNPGRKVFWSVGTSGLSGSISSIRINGLCQSDYIVSASCISGQSCMS